MVAEKLDEDHDGRFEISNELAGGKLARRTVSSAKGDRTERVESFENGKLAKAELDENGDGRVDLWNFHDASGALVRQEQDANHDGRVDTWVGLDPKSGKELEVRKDANFDGNVDSVRKTDTAGVPQRLEEDRNGDGKPDRVVTFAGGRPARFEEDTNGDGKPDLEGELDANGQSMVEKRDADGDGRYELRVSYRRRPEDQGGAGYQGHRPLRRRHHLRERRGRAAGAGQQGHRPLRFGAPVQGR